MSEKCWTIFPLEQRQEQGGFRPKAGDFPLLCDNRENIVQTIENRPRFRTRNPA
jgi:hypothetical protein